MLRPQRLAFILLIYFLPVHATGQEVHRLTFNEAAAIAIRNSFSMHDIELDLKVKHYGYIARRAGLRSRVDLFLTAPELRNELQEKFDQETQLYGDFVENTTLYDGRLSITQPLPSNGKIAANINLDRFKQSGANSEYTTNFFMSFDQPIFVPNQLQRDIFRAELRLEKAKIDYMQQRVSLIYGRSFNRRNFGGNDFRRLFGGFGGGGDRGGGRGGGSSLSQNYYLLYEHSKLLEFDSRYFAIWEDLKTIALERMNAGTISERENLQIGVEFANSENVLFSSTTRRERSKRQLIQFLGLDPDDDIIIDALLEYKPVEIDREKAIQQGIANNTGIRGFLISIQEDSMRIDDVAAQGRITGNLSATYGLNNSDQSIRLHFDEFSQTRSLKLGLGVPVWDWGRNDMSLEATGINLETKKRELQNDIVDTERQIIGHVYNISLMRERTDLLNRAKNLARQGLNIARQQFIDGTISSEDMILAVKKNYQAETEYLELLVDHKIALIQLANQTQWDFENNVSIRAEIEQIIDTIIVPK